MLVLLTSYFILASARTAAQPRSIRKDVFDIVAMAVIAALLLSMAIILFEPTLYNWQQSFLPRLLRPH